MKINPFRVQFIMNSMRKCYDPSLSILVVCPVDTKEVKNVQSCKYYVVQKIGCLKAFKELDKTEEFTTLYGHRKGTVLCYILGSNRQDLMQYGNQRENFITGQFARRTLPQDLLHHFQSLSKKDSSVNAIKVVERMSRLCCIRPDECTALDKLCKWSREGFAALMEVVDKYEVYGTLDVKMTGNQQALARGDKFAIPNVLLRLVAKCPEEFFLAKYEQVLNRSLSLKDLALEYQETLEIDKVYKALVVIANHERLETLLEQHPGKFESQQMKDYVGAVINKNTKNEKAFQLKNYYESVVSNDKDFVNPVVFECIESVVEGIESNDVVEKSDILVYIMKEKNPEAVMSIITGILGGDKDYHAAILVFASEQDYFGTLSFLRGQSATAAIKDFQIIPLVFEKHQEFCADVIENITFATLFGKFTITKPPLFTYHSNLTQLSKVVECICPPQADVGIVCDPGIVPIKMHNHEQNRNVTYYGGNADILKFRKKLNSDKYPVHELLPPDTTDTSANTASTSTTPTSGRTPATSATPGKSQLDDSGIGDPAAGQSSDCSRSLLSQFGGDDDDETDVDETDADETDGEGHDTEGRD